MAEKFNEADVLALWRCARKHNSSIPDEALNAMRKTLLDILRQQAGRVDEDEGFDPRKFVRHMAEVLEAGGDMFKIDADLARLGAAIQAALAQNTQGDGEPVAWAQMEDGKCVGLAFKPAPNADCVTPLYIHAERARVPAEYPEDGRVPDDYRNQAVGFRSGWNECRAAMLAAAPSQRAEVK